jgi:hypothetical protein
VNSNWFKADAEQQADFKPKLDDLKRQIEELRPRTIPLSERLATIRAADRQREAERRQLLREYKGLDGRQRGESFRRLFKKVVLSWRSRQTAHTDRPGRTRKTSRPPRRLFELEKEKIDWQMADSVVSGSWS